MASPSRTCMCSPTRHPGSFKCSRHRRSNHPPKPAPGRRAASSNYRELALIAGANPHKAFLLQAVRSSRSSGVNMQRRRSFQPKPSRFYLLYGNRNGSGVSLS
ncbi:hypothetical protein like AT5G11090 [Hibiscus trionum]|uniref:Uncharacterized protein n=1 Tax=Hibiscus trionum TaxID=183268 RepID=A0A9W7HTH4_HIBTR|nr:hypothetical protein like AT5G11090 [Hibiscus trionum]